MRANLFIAGACKSGTSFLHEFLGKQNDICASDPKEPYFFELPKDERDEKVYYEKYFKSYSSEKYLVDGRHRNMFFSWIPQAIFDFNNDAKIIFILRDPIERAYSHWWMWYARNIIKTKFHKTLLREIKRISEKGLQMDFTPEEYVAHIKNESPKGRAAYADATTIVETGYYYTQISKFKKLFKEDQLLIIDYKEISNLELLSKKLERFLEIDFLSITQKKLINKAPEFSKPGYSIGKYLPKKMKAYLKKKFFKKQEIEEKSKILLKAHYREENRKLYEELDVEFVKQWI